MKCEAPVAPVPTLLELLAEVAAYIERVAGTYVGAPNHRHTETAARLRAAATRLQEEMEFAAQKRCDFARADRAVSTRAWELVEQALRSVNGGPAMSEPGGARK